MEKPPLINKLRGPKIKGVAIFDVVATFMGAFLLSRIKIFKDFNIFIITIILFIILILIAIATHYALGIPTMLNYYLGINTLNEVLESRKKRDII